MTALRSTPLRLTGTLIAIFALFTVAGYGAGYLVTHAALTRDVAARLEQTLQTVRSIPEQDEIVERAAEIAAAARSRDLLLRYAIPGGPTVGNLPEPVGVVSGAIVGHSDLPLPEDALADSYLAWQGEVGHGTLTLLVGRDSLMGLSETFLTVLLLSLLPALLLATVIGALVARNARDRVEAIRTTLAQLTSGLTGARVPVPRDAADDLGQIAVAVNRMAEAQEASTEALRQVSADIAHDLRTPIQRVAVLLDRLEGTALTGPAREIVAAARAEAAQIVETFHGLLQIAQLGGGQARAGLADVDFAALVADLADVYGPASEDERPSAEHNDRRPRHRQGRPHAARAPGGQPDRECLAPHASRPNSASCRGRPACGPDCQRRGAWYPGSRARACVSSPLPAGTKPDQPRERSRPEPGRSDRGTPRRTSEARRRGSGADGHAGVWGLNNGSLAKSPWC